MSDRVSDSRSDSNYVHDITKPDEIISVQSPGDTEIKVVSVSVQIGDRVRKGTVLFQYIPTKTPTPAVTQNIKSSVVGIVRKVSVIDGDVIPGKSEVMCIEKHCDHSVIAFNLCAICGLNLKSGEGRKRGDDANVTMLHAIPGIRINHEEAELLGNKDKQRLLLNRKLALVVDLDQTLIHTSVDRNIERGLPDVYGFTLPGHPFVYHCRLRPSSMKFLEAVSKLYEMHVFTMGTKDYAIAVTKILDPGKKLFSDRIISRDECFDLHSKALRLKSVFPCGDEMVAIIDDREEVWHSCPNLVHVKPYIFFAGTSDINAPPLAQSCGQIHTQPAHWSPSQKTAGLQQQLPTATTITPTSANTSCNNNKDNKAVQDSSSSSDSSLSSSSSSSESSGDESDDEKNKISKMQYTQEDESVCKSDKSLKDSHCFQSELQTQNSSQSVCQNKPRQEINDPDKFLIHLQDILERIHATFYTEYDKIIEDCNECFENILIPDLKKIIPRLRHSVLKGAKIVFSGVIPTNLPKTRSREWNTARAFGAIVQDRLIARQDANSKHEATTHLIVGRPGTNKHHQAQKMNTIKIVKPSWLWACAERWKWVNEDSYAPENIQTSAATNSSKRYKIETGPLHQEKDELDQIKFARNIKHMDNVTNNQSRRFSVSSEELDKMEAEINRELSDDEEDGDEDDVTLNERMEEGKQDKDLAGTSTHPDIGVEGLCSNIDNPDTVPTMDSFGGYLELDKDTPVLLTKKRKHDEVDLSSPSNSLDSSSQSPRTSEEESSGEDDELALLLGL